MEITFGVRLEEEGDDGSCAGTVEGKDPAYHGANEREEMYKWNHISSSNVASGEGNLP